VLILNNLHCIKIVQDLPIFCLGKRESLPDSGPHGQKEKAAARLPQITNLFTTKNNPEVERIQETNWIAGAERLSTEWIRRRFGGVKGKAGAAKLS
jgi:hypothetical protein